MTDQEPHARTLTTRQARSGRVGYTDPVEIHDTTRSRIELVTFFVDRTAGTELALKLIRYEKHTGGLPVQTAEINLDPAAGRRLLRALNEHNAVANEGHEGSYIVISVEEGAVQVGELDPTVVASAIARLLGEDQIMAHLADLDLPREMVSAFRGAIRLKELRTALARLRQHLESGQTDEQTYQLWCQEHSWAFGNAYVVNDRIRAISRSDQVDLLIPRVLGGFRDLIELKRPDKEVLAWDSAHRNYYFTSEVSRALGQCHRYLDVLQEDARHGLRDAPEVIAYHPRATVVIGRSHDWSDEKQRALHGLNSRLSGISVITYDHLLVQGQQTLDLLENPADEDVIVPEWSGAVDEWGDEEPF